MDELQLLTPSAALLLTLPGHCVGSMPAYHQAHRQDCEQNKCRAWVYTMFPSHLVAEAWTQMSLEWLLPPIVHLESGKRGDSLTGSGHKNFLLISSLHSSTAFAGRGFEQHNLSNFNLIEGEIVFYTDNCRIKHV